MIKAIKKIKNRILIKKNMLIFDLRLQPDVQF